MDSTDTGGSSYLLHVSHAAQAIAAGKCKVALVTLAGRPRSEGSSGLVPRNINPLTPDTPWELPYGGVTVNMYALAAARALMDSDRSAEDIARRAMGIAADICVYTNRNITVETLQGA